MLYELTWCCQLTDTIQRLSKNVYHPNSACQNKEKPRVFVIENIYWESYEKFQWFDLIVVKMQLKFKYSRQNMILVKSCQKQLNIKHNDLGTSLPQGLYFYGTKSQYGD